MDFESGKSRWLKAAAVALSMLAIFQLEIFFPGMQPKQTFIRTAIEILAFVPFVVLYRNQIRSKKWVAFLVKLACGLFAINLLFLFIGNNQAAQSAFSRFADWSGDWLPAFLALPFAIYSISKTAIREHRSSKV